LTAAARACTIDLQMRRSIVSVSTAAIVLVLGSSCGTDPADAFVGTWTSTDAAIDSVGSCGPSGSIGAIDLTGMTITEVDRSHITATFVANGAACELGFTVSGATATVKPDQSCSISDGTTSGAFEITDGNLYLYTNFLLLSLHGGFVPPGATVISTTCYVSAVGTFRAS
jgi:hypothetical protein